MKQVKNYTKILHSKQYKLTGISQIIGDLIVLAIIFMACVIRENVVCITILKQRPACTAATTCYQHCADTLGRSTLHFNPQQAANLN